MKVYSEVVWDIESLQIIDSTWYEYQGALHLACGPSTAMQNEQAASADLGKTMSQDFSQRFGEQSDFIHGINAALAPTLAGGASQHGFSADELAAKNSAAINEAGAANANAARAVAGQLAGRGGDSGLQSGVDAQIRASVTSQQAANLANNQLKITNEDFATGRDQYNRAVTAEDILAGKADPSGLGSGAIRATDQAFTESEANSKASNQVWADLGGLAGSAMSMIPGVGGMAGGMFKKSLSNGGDSAIGSGGS